MNRRTPLKRTAALARKTGLRAVTPLKAKSAPARTGRIKPVSAKRARDNRERRQLVAELFGGIRPRCMWPGCEVLADDVHEILPRARGGSITDPSIWAALCRPHHRRATSEDPQAYEAGLLFHSWQAQEAHTVRLVAAWRTADGQLVREAPAPGEMAS